MQITTKRNDKKTDRSDRKLRRRIIFFLALFVTAAALFFSTSDLLAAALKIEINGTVIKFKDQRIDVSVDGVALPLTEGAPGLELLSDEKDDRYMVSLEDVFVNGLKAQCDYDEASGNITLTLHDHTIVMTMGDKYAYVDGVLMKMPYEPVNVTFLDSNITKLMVDSEFVTEKLGYIYAWQNNSSTSGSVFITTPELYTYQEQTHTAPSGDWTVRYDKKKLSLSQMPALSIGDCLYVPAKKVFSKKMGASYAYDAETKQLTLSKNGITLSMTEGETLITVNGAEQTLTHAPYYVTRQATGYSCIMLPVKEICELLLFDYEETVLSENQYRADIFRKDVVYLEQTAEDPSGNGIAQKTITAVKAERSSRRDVITLTMDQKPNIVVKSTDTKIKILLKNTYSASEELSYTPEDPYLLKGLTITQKSSKRVMVTIRRNGTKQYTVKATAGGVKITLKNKKESDPNAILIAVDCGHGAYTAGKRTPPMPFSIDIDKDGVYDIQKGEQYREHYASVGVGKYLKEALLRCGFQVYESAFGTEDIPLVTRQNTIKSLKCDYSVSIHWNAYGDGASFNSANGIGVYYYSNPKYAGDSKALGEIMQKYLLKGTPQTDRGVDGQNQWAMTNCYLLGTKASILVELAFMTNQHEATTMMANQSYWKESAEELCQAFCEYTGVPYVK